jgi:hypothetical protein
VLLTIKEHFRAHVLLADSYPEEGNLALACTFMLRNYEGKSLEERENEFEYLRVRAAKFISDLHTGRIKSEAEIENIRQARLTAEPRTFSDQAKANMAEARLKTWEERRKNGKDKEISAKRVATRKANGKYKMSEEQKRKISEGQIGRIPWNKGKKGAISEETRAKMSAAKKGKAPPNKGVTGKPAHNKGVPATEDAKRKMRESRLAYIQKNGLYEVSDDTRKKISTSKTGTKRTADGKYVKECYNQQQ